VRIEAIQTCHTRTEAFCERPGCIIFYKGEQCIFCDVAKEVLNETLSLYGFSWSIVQEVDVDNINDPEYMTDIVGVPSIRIGSNLITGLPDEHLVGTALIHAILTGCFSTVGSCHLA
jgi:hypothetical protein